MALNRIVRQVHRFSGSLHALCKLTGWSTANHDHHPSKSQLCGGRAMRIVLVFALLLGYNLSLKAQATCSFAAGNYNPCDYDAGKIVQEMIHPHSNLVMLAAHRGAHNTINPSINETVLAPENSLESIGAAALLGYEMAEVDIKLSSDSVPMLSHDTTWGREALCPGCSAGGEYFNPFGSYTPAQQALNPAVASLTAAQSKLYTLWTVQNPSAHTGAVASLQDLLTYMTTNQIAMVLAIDVKDIPSALACWQVIKNTTDYLGRPYYKSVVFKMGGQIFGQTPALFESTFGSDYPNVLYWPYYATNMISPTGKNFGSEANMISSLQAWQASSVQMVGTEVNLKQNGGILTQMLAAAKTYNGVYTTSVGSFSPTAEYLAPRDTTPQFFIGKDAPNSSPPTYSGYCCYELSSVYYNGAPYNQPSDTADNRGDLVNFLVPNGITVVTTDEVTTYGETLQNLGLRHTEWLQADASQGDPHCGLNGQYPGCDANGTTVYTSCAPENGTCSFPGVRVVAFGANGSYNYKTVTNSTACTASAFPPDPLPGVVKGCYYGPAIWDPGPPFNPQGVYCADENGVCNFNGSANGIFAVGYQGSSSSFQNSFNCNLDTFGGASNDPHAGLVKTCFYQLNNNTAGGPSGYVLCAAEGQTCTFAGAGRIAFGVNGNFSYRTFPAGPSVASSGGAPCNTSVFRDPAPGVVKACYYQYAIAVGANVQLGSGSSGLTSTGGNFSGPGEPNGTVPALNPDTADTFTVNAGGTSFTVSQPNDSVATYTWTTGGQPSEVLTSASGSGLGYALTNVPVATYSGAVTSDSITVDPTTTYQTIDGFGGAMTDSAASLILGSSNHSQMMQTLFGTGAGNAGLTMVRSPMGSSDMMASSTDIHTYEDTQGSFSANGYASDQRQITALQQAKAIVGSNFKILGTPWSAPGWMKRGGSLLPAQCGTDQNEVDVTKVSQYAQYFIGYVNAYSNAGLTPWALSLQNEPENCKTAMPTTLMSATDEVALAGAIKSVLGNNVKILGWDHNWNDPYFVDTLVASGSVDAIGYHCYDGTHYSNQTTSVPTYMTECSGFTASSANVAQNLGWEIANLLIGPLRYGSRGSIYWTLAQDPNGNPHLGGSDACQDCRGMLTVNSDGSFEPSQDLYYWAQFSKFVPPGSVRIASNNSGNLSTVAFKNGNQNTLIVLNSATAHANGGVAGSDERDLRGHIVQWDGDTATQKTAWLVGSDGHRRWVSDGSTYNCLKYDAGMQGPDVEPGGALDKYINLLYVWAVCGQVTMGTDSELELGTYLKSTNGARLTLTSGGLTAVDASGTSQWAPGGVGNRLILQEDGNLVLYEGSTMVWASNTVGSGAIWLSMRDDGSFALFNKANQKVWVSQINPNNYKGKIVEWDGDTATQKTSWLVGADGNRRWIPDLATFNCLHAAGYGNALSLSTEVLSEIPNLDNVWAACGNTDHLGPNGALEQGANLISGNYYLGLTSTDLVLLQNGTKIWDTGHGGVELRVQSDGNVVIYDASGNATWSTGTNRSNPGNLILGNDGSLRLWDGNNNNIWSRNSSEVPVGPPSYFYCANENSQCNFQGYGAVIFGGVEPSNYSGQIIFHNGTSCSNTSFPQDPDPGVAKKCWYLITVPPPSN